MKVWYWFKLVTEGQLEDTAEYVELDDIAIVDQFREAVKVKCSPELDKVTAKNLGVYKNEESWKNSSPKMKASSKLCEEEVGLGVELLGQNDDDMALIVVVPPKLNILKEKHMAYKKTSAETLCR